MPTISIANVLSPIARSDDVTGSVPLENANGEHGSKSISLTPLPHEQRYFLSSTDRTPAANDSSCICSIRPLIDLATSSIFMEVLSADS